MHRISKLFSSLQMSLVCRTAPVLGPHRVINQTSGGHHLVDLPGLWSRFILPLTHFTYFRYFQYTDPQNFNHRTSDSNVPVNLDRGLYVYYRFRHLWFVENTNKLIRTCATVHTRKTNTFCNCNGAVTPTPSRENKRNSHSTTAMLFTMAGYFTTSLYVGYARFRKSNTYHPWRKVSGIYYAILETSSVLVYWFISAYYAPELREVMLRKVIACWLHFFQIHGWILSIYWDLHILPILIVSAGVKRFTGRAGGGDVFENLMQIINNDLIGVWEEILLEMRNFFPKLTINQILTRHYIARDCFHSVRGDQHRSTLIAFRILKR